MYILSCAAIPSLYACILLISYHGQGFSYRYIPKISHIHLSGHLLLLRLLHSRRRRPQAVPNVMAVPSVSPSTRVNIPLELSLYIGNIVRGILYGENSL